MLGMLLVLASEEVEEGLDDLSLFLLKSFPKMFRLGVVTAGGSGTAAACGTAAV